MQLPSVLVVSSDPAWRAAAAALVHACDAPCIGAVEPAARLAPAGVVLVDNRDAITADGVVLRVGVDERRVCELPAPLELPVLRAALLAAASGLRARGLLLDGRLECAFKRLVELSSESIEVVDERVRLLYVNPAFERITGYEMPAVLGRTTGELFRAGTHEPSFYAGIMRTLNAGEVWRGQLVARRVDGALSYQESVLAPYAGPDGSRAGFVALKRDVARDDLIARAVDNLSAQRAALLNEAADAFVLHDEAGQVLDRNARAASMFGLDEHGAGRTLLDAVRSHDAEHLKSAWRSLTPGEALALDVVLRRPAGDAPTVAFRCVRVRVANEDLVLSLVRDVSERVALERSLERRGEDLAQALTTLRHTTTALVEREKLAALGGLVAGFAHELGTPLGVAVTAASLAVIELDELRAADHAPGSAHAEGVQGARDSLALVTASLARLVGLVDALKRLSLENSADARTDDEVELGAQVEHAVAHCTPTLLRHGVAVSIEGAPLHVRCDAAALALVLQELIVNAAEHAYAGRGGQVRVALRGEDGVVSVTVDDDGPGIAADVYPKIFEPFFTTARARGHAGLGLHLCHTLALHRLGGALTVGHSDSAGARFCLRLGAAGTLSRPSVTPAADPPMAGAPHPRAPT